ncbi:hypothetical protein [Pseudochryseolinea flava]|uniref:Uncharacterized protein n=1 Tax=Pseudochryseolinea flava TaxID=2059302 RepID=A0A364Y1S1_9BACT|nr:hypothetical protein [Pseudochryseolinea flava]RAW00580.1 hypothetical protein DQQ10_13360 [Pseudochryseolinea flava]
MKLEDYKKCFAQHYTEFVLKHRIGDDQVTENVAYEKIKNVLRVDLGEGQFFYFKEGRLQMIYISNETVIKKLWEEFKRGEDIDNPDQTLRSRAGKTSNQLVFPSRGIAASVTHDEVDFMELYPPCTMEDYLENIYREFQPFIR